MSPNHSLTGRLRSGSKNSTGRPDFDPDTILSRHGPGKASVRSIRSTKMSLAEISESEPIALNKDAFDKADAAPPLKADPKGAAQRPTEFDDANAANTDVFHNMMGDDDFLDPSHVRHHEQPPNDPYNHQHQNNVPQRPSSSQSYNTFQQCQDAFGDFDGVHWVPEHDNDPYAPPPDFELHRPRAGTGSMPRPQAYMNHETGQQMLYYPARVPAMLNLPPKLSNKPKVAERNNRRSQVLSAMLDGNAPKQPLPKEEEQRQQRDSWLPDPLTGHRNSFAALSSHEWNIGGEDAKSLHADEQQQMPQQTSVETEDEPLRRPQKLSQTDDKRKSRMAHLDNLPPQLRASAYFDMPSAAPEIQVKDGSAMATLDSILDASTTAPVSAFTDHAHGKLGTETYGKEKKRSSLGPSAAIRAVSEEPEPKKRSHFKWLKRGDDKKRKSTSDLKNSDAGGAENGAAAAGSADGDNVIHHENKSEVEGESEGEESEDEGAQGPPTTLLAELQMRKYQQKKRTQMSSRADPEGMHATLLEMDAVAETQRKSRKNKRVNLAWEDPGANPDEGDSDDEDVPLALIVARNQGSRSMLDINRPIGLMEKRELEENEPLSHRKARLNGQDPRQMLAQRASMMNLTGPVLAHSRSRSDLSGQVIAPEPEDDEVEGETLAERRRRLAAKDEGEDALPKARPVSGSFSMELLSQFGDLDEKEPEEKTSPKPGEEETLGQRRRRLQSEREARAREMGQNNLDGTTGPQHNQRLSMAGVLGAHPKNEHEERLMERRRKEEDHRRARDQETKLSAYRNLMPKTLIGPDVKHSGGFRGGVFNDSGAGLGPLAARSSPALHTQAYGGNHLQHRASAVFSSYGTPMHQNNAYGQMNTLNPYGNGAMQPGMQMPVSGGSVDRVEQWRQGIHH